MPLPCPCMPLRAIDCPCIALACPCSCPCITFAWPLLMPALHALACPRLPLHCTCLPLLMPWHCPCLPLPLHHPRMPLLHSFPKIALALHSLSPPPNNTLQRYIPRSESKTEARRSSFQLLIVLFKLGSSCRLAFYFFVEIHREN